jgi:hypothetical protein
MIKPTGRTTAEEVTGAHFTTARERLGSAHWLHTAPSDFHDVLPANALGIDSAWINKPWRQAAARRYAEITSTRDQTAPSTR